jgi:Protein of unknown function (DUF1161)
MVANNTGRNMKTAAKTNSVSTTRTSTLAKMIGAIALSLSSFAVWSSPLKCETLTHEIERKLSNNGAKNYQLTVVEQSTSVDQMKVVGTCVGGKKKVLYAKGRAPEVNNSAIAIANSQPDEVVSDAIDDAEVYARKLIPVMPKNGSSCAAPKSEERTAWERTRAVWDLRFEPECSFEIKVSESNEGVTVVPRTVLTTIRYKN